MVIVPPELEDLVMVFLEHRGEDLEIISDALRQKEYNKIQALGLPMKNSGGSFDTITEIGQAPQVATEIEDRDSILRCADHFSDYLQQVRVAGQRTP